MSKERELILDLYDHLNHSDVDCRFDVSDIIKKVDEYLSQPEPFKPDWANYRQGVADSKRKPLSDDAIQQIINTKHFDTRYIDKSNLRWYKQGVKDAEKAHGIGETG